MSKRTDIIFSEIHSKLVALNCTEFEYYWEIWGVMWYPWFIEIDGKSENFSFNDLTQKDLEELIKDEKIEIIKIYSKDEMNDEFDRKRYRIKSR
ncbi:hypothetical protein [uncultured Marivirga sp.]|uniref:hypothetical protein n=1 Tax=uncultured Marivirga sp. TaxID=1123707 RepID=UPI0030ED2E2E|tara:strand:+ start:496 stop:777 length:282 start_codon:yes stop_codon:yes gene_type:complete